jgi:hypothetical protein
LEFFRGKHAVLSLEFFRGITMKNMYPRQGGYGY